MLKSVQARSSSATGNGNETILGSPLHPSVRAVLDRLGLDAAIAPSDEAWRRLLVELGAAFAAGGERRQHRPAAEVLVAQLAEAAGLADGATLLDRVAGVPNHEALMIALRGALRSVSDSAEVAVLLVGVDGLTRVSDRLGESGRTELLGGVAERIRSVVRAADLVTKAEGDEFAVLLGGLASPEPVRAISHRLERAFSEPLVAAGHYVYFTAHVGAALARAGSSAADALRRGRMALEWQRSTRTHATARAPQLRQVAVTA